MNLSKADITELTTLRRALHQNPEISGEEFKTAQRVVTALPVPDSLITGLGGAGVAAVFGGHKPGPTVMFRAELDALPIHETGTHAHISEVVGKAHLCGHDGHMSILIGLAKVLTRQRPERGRVVLLFQPAEETGAGAAAVLDDPKFVEIAPDYAFALHNRPGLPLSHVGLASGPVTCASRGMKITLRGKEAHAAEPDTGVSPMIALSRLMPGLAGLSRGELESENFRLVTITHASMGAAAFGVAPGVAHLFATLRTRVDAGMQSLCAEAEALLHQVCAEQGLRGEQSYEDVFQHCENDAEATKIMQRALNGLGIRHDQSGCPMRASEDFGRFGQNARSAMFFLGSGVDHPALHNPDYDFPDALIPVAVKIFHRVTCDLLG